MIHGLPDDGLRAFSGYLGIEPFSVPSSEEPDILVAMVPRHPSSPHSSSCATHLQLVREASGRDVLKGIGGAVLLPPKDRQTRVELFGDTLSGHFALLHAALSRSLMLRGVAVLHAAVVNAYDRTLLIVGESGTGKSTLSLTLALRGARLLSDDTVALRLESADRVMATPFRPDLLLRQPSLSILPPDLRQAAELFQAEGEQKWRISRGRMHGMTADAALPDTLIFLESGAGATRSSRVRELGATEAMARLMHAFGAFFLSRKRPLERESVAGLFEGLLSQGRPYSVQLGRSLLDDPDRGVEEFLSLLV